MTSDEQIKKIFDKLSALESEVAALREGYVVVNKRYTQTLDSVKGLTANALEAAMRSAAAAENSALACKHATAAAVASAAVSVAPGRMLAFVSTQSVEVAT